MGHVEGRRRSVARPKRRMVSESLPLALQVPFAASASEARRQPLPIEAAAKDAHAGQGGLRPEPQGCWPWRSRSTIEATMILQPGPACVWSPPVFGRHGACSAGWPLQRRSNNRPKAAPSRQREVRWSSAAGRQFPQIVSSQETPQTTNSEPSSKPGEGEATGRACRRPCHR